MLKICKGKKWKGQIFEHQFCFSKHWIQVWKIPCQTPSAPSNLYSSALSHNSVLLDKNPFISRLESPSKVFMIIFNILESPDNFYVLLHVLRCWEHSPINYDSRPRQRWKSYEADWSRATNFAFRCSVQRTCALNVWQFEFRIFCSVKTSEQFVNATAWM